VMKRFVQYVAWNIFPGNYSTATLNAKCFTMSFKTWKHVYDYGSLPIAGRLWSIAHLFLLCTESFNKIAKGRDTERLGPIGLVLVVDHLSHNLLTP
jgi:hypothetical protein